MSKKPSKTVLKKALYDHYGIVLDVANYFKVGTNAVYSWIKSYNLEQDRNEAKLNMKELAEGSLVKNIKKGKEVSTIFFLKTRYPEEYSDQRKEEEPDDYDFSLLTDKERGQLERLLDKCRINED